MKEEGIAKVTIRVPSKLYIEYKKVLIDLGTNTTYNLLAHIKEVVENSKQSIEAGYEVNEKLLRRDAELQMFPNGEDEDE